MNPEGEGANGGTANAAWLVLAVIAFNLSRAAATLTGGGLATATTPTLRRTLIDVPARIAQSACRLLIHLPVALAAGFRRTVPPSLRATRQHPTLTTPPQRRDPPDVEHPDSEVRSRACPIRLTGREPTTKINHRVNRWIEA